MEQNFCVPGSVTFFRIRAFASPWITKYATSRKLEEIVCILTPRKQFKRISHSHIQMWKLDYKGWPQKNRCFQTVVPEKTLESPLDCKEIQPFRPKGTQSWTLIERTDAKAVAPIFGHLIRRTDFGKDPDAGKDWRREEKGTTEDEIVGWYHQLNGNELEPTLGDGEGQWKSGVLQSMRKQRVGHDLTKQQGLWHVPRPGTLEHPE